MYEKELELCTLIREKRVFSSCPSNDAFLETPLEFYCGPASVQDECFLYGKGGVPVDVMQLFTGDGHDSLKERLAIIDVRMYVDGGVGHSVCVFVHKVGGTQREQRVPGELLGGKYALTLTDSNFTVGGMPDTYAEADDAYLERYKVRPLATLMSYIKEQCRPIDIHFEMPTVAAALPMNRCRNIRFPVAHTGERMGLCWTQYCVSWLLLKAICCNRIVILNELVLNVINSCQCTVGKDMLDCFLKLCAIIRQKEAEQVLLMHFASIVKTFKDCNEVRLPIYLNLDLRPMPLEHDWGKYEGADLLIELTNLDWEADESEYWDPYAQKWDASKLTEAIKLASGKVKMPPISRWDAHTRLVMKLLSIVKPMRQHFSTTVDKRASRHFSEYPEYYVNANAYWNGDTGTWKDELDTAIPDKVIDILARNIKSKKWTRGEVEQSWIDDIKREKLFTDVHDALAEKRLAAVLRKMYEDDEFIDRFWRGYFKPNTSHPYKHS